MSSTVASSSSFAITRPDLPCLISYPLSVAEIDLNSREMVSDSFSFTVMVMLSEILSPQSRVMVTSPAFSSVTTPFWDTVATLSSELSHTRLAFASAGVIFALSLIVSPIHPSAFPPEILTDSTGITGVSLLGRTSISTLAAISPLAVDVAVMVATPTPFAVITPDLSTVSTDLSELFQVKVF